MIPLVRQHLDAAISTFPFGKRFAVANKPLFGLLVSRVFRDDPDVMALIRTTIVPTRVDGSFPAANVLPTVASATFSAADFDKMVFNPSTDTSIFVRAVANPGAQTSDTLTITY
jgi:hypothetical protein